MRKDSFCKLVFIAFAITSDDSIVPDFKIFTSQILNTNDRDNESMDSVDGTQYVTHRINLSCISRADRINPIVKFTTTIRMAANVQT